MSSHILLEEVSNRSAPGSLAEDTRSLICLRGVHLQRKGGQ